MNYDLNCFKIHGQEILSLRQRDGDKIPNVIRTFLEQGFLGKNSQNWLEFFGRFMTGPAVIRTRYEGTFAHRYH